MANGLRDHRALTKLNLAVWAVLGGAGGGGGQELTMIYSAMELGQQEGMPWPWASTTTALALPSCICRYGRRIGWPASGGGGEDG